MWGLTFFYVIYSLGTTITIVGRWSGRNSVGTGQH